jgi:hypothetical protein
MVVLLLFVDSVAQNEACSSVMSLTQWMNFLAREVMSVAHRMRLVAQCVMSIAQWKNFLTHEVTSISAGEAGSSMGDYLFLA